MTGKSKTADRPAVHSMASTALMAAVLCLLGPVSLPIGPVPISLGTLGIYLALYLLGWKRGTVSVLIYLLLGLVGLPVFSGGGGPAYVLHPTFGFLLGYLAAAFLIGFLCRKDPLPRRQACACAAGLAAIYLVGLPYMALILNVYLGRGVDLWGLLWLGMLPFLPADALKIAAAVFLSRRLLPALDRGAGRDT